MSLYLWLDLLVAAGPLALSFDRRVFYVRLWPTVLASSAIVGIPFAVWDVLAAAAGTWWWRGRFAGSPLVYSLPPGELAFFVAVPFSCLFVYEVLSAYLPARRVPFPRWAGFAVALASFAAALAALPRSYTAIVLTAFGLFFLLTALLRPSLLQERTVWAAFAASFIPFAVVNGILTALPVVLYNPSAILGLRISTIPIEDFFYSFSLLGYLLLVYRGLRDRRYADRGRHGGA